MKKLEKCKKKSAPYYQAHSKRQIYGVDIIIRCFCAGDRNSILRDDIPETGIEGNDRVILPPLFVSPALNDKALKSDNQIYLYK